LKWYPGIKYFDTTHGWLPKDESAKTRSSETVLGTKNSKTKYPRPSFTPEPSGALALHPNESLPLLALTISIEASASLHRTPGKVAIMLTVALILLLPWENARDLSFLILSQ
jgi:hypothetical protein